MKKTELVRMQKKNGKVVQDCDIYIGPKMQNASWDLSRSKWCNPFYDRDNPKRANEQYERHVLSTESLRSDIPTLVGKVLGCFCKDDKSCHGQVLLKLATQHQKANAPPYLNAPNVIYFKGENAVLSNFYNFPLKIDGLTFFGVQHAYAYKQALGHEQSHIAKRILDCQSSKAAYKIITPVIRGSSSVPGLGLCWSHETAIEIMTELIRKKWAQCRDFREFVQQKVLDKFPVEATTSPFWGAGVDLLDVVKKQDYRQQIFGMNILGWIIYCVGLENLVQERETVDTVLEKVLEKNDNEVNPVPVFRGLRFVRSVLYPEEEEEEDAPSRID